jgi:hypothetical protein
MQDQWGARKISIKKEKKFHSGHGFVILDRE